MTKGYIYFIQADNVNLIKIGYAENVTARLRCIRTISPVHLRLLLVLNGDTSTERHLHRHFGKYRVHGEWFSPSGELTDFIKKPFQIECYNDTGAICNGVCRNGKSCQRQRLFNTDYCVIHQNQVNGIPDGWIKSRPKRRCKAITKAGQACTCFAMRKQVYCTGHIGAATNGR